MPALKPRIYGNVTDQGVFVPEKPDLFKKYVASFRGYVELIIKKPGTQRSKQQNAYYWGVVMKMIIHEMSGGLENEKEKKRIHRMLLMLHASEMVHGVFVPRESSDFSTVEMEEYLAKVRAWASSFLNIYIPLPNEVAF